MSKDAAFFAVPITKVEENADGSLYVFGKATGPDLDLDQQIIDKDFAEGAVREWFKSYGNVRQMHSVALAPAGKAVELTSEEDGEYIKAKVVEPGAIKLTKEGVYSAFSIGLTQARIIADPVAKGGRIVDGIVTEVSLVDFPANPTCKFAVTKAASVAVEDGHQVAEEWEDVGTHELVDEAHKAVVASVTKEAPEEEPVVEEMPTEGSPAAPVEIPAEEEPAAPVEDAPAEEEPVAPGEEEVSQVVDAPPAVEEAPTEEEATVEEAALPEMLKALRDRLAGDVAKAAPEAVNAAMLAAVHAALASEVAEDAGTGSQAYDICWLADLYADLVCWAECDTWDEIWEEVLAGARDPEIAKTATVDSDDARAKVTKAVARIYAALAAGHPKFCATAEQAASAPVAGLSQDAIQKMIDAAVKPRDDKIAELEATVAKLGSEPDPKEAPVRGGTGGVTPVTIEETEEATEVLKAHQGEGDERAEEYVRYLREMTKHPQTSIALAARDELTKLGRSVDPDDDKPSE